MRAPKFWDIQSGRNDWRAQFLLPLGWLYSFATASRIRNGAQESLNVPVICIGSIYIGGSGKTPTVIAICEKLRDAFYNPHIVTRGYKGTITKPTEVNPNIHSAAQIGDEALLLSAFARTWVAKDRALGAKKAVAAGATAIVLDDGFQDTSLFHDISIIVVDAEIGFGNGLCLPAGPLREPISVGLSRGDILLSIGNTNAQLKFDAKYKPAYIQRVKGELLPIQTGIDWTETPLIAFAGIARPEKFFATLKSLGAKILHCESLGDHEHLSPMLLRRLDIEAKKNQAQLVTTEKDAARLPPAYRSKIITLPVRLTIKEASLLDQAIQRLAKDKLNPLLIKKP